MTHAKSNFAAQQLNAFFYKRGWQKYGIHAYATESASQIDIQWKMDGAAEVVRADPLALLQWLDKAPRRYSDLDAILRRKLGLGHPHNLLGTTTPERHAACLARLNASRDRAGHFAVSLKTDGSPFARV